MLEYQKKLSVVDVVNNIKNKNMKGKIFLNIFAVILSVIVAVELIFALKNLFFK